MSWLLINFCISYFETRNYMITPYEKKRLGEKIKTIGITNIRLDAV